MKQLIVLFLLTGLIGCSSAKKEAGISEVEIGQSLAAKKYSNIYFSSQPKVSDFNALQNEEFVLVVNLREPEEHNESAEKNAVKNAGMAYANVPFPASAGLNDALIESVTTVVMKHRKAGKILIHCSTGNRSGVWAGGHFHKDHGSSKKESIAIAKKLGVNKPEAMEKLKTYLSKK